jgi:GT2 family glycosyltransferase
MEKKIDPGFVDILILFFNKVDQTISCIESFLPSGQKIYVLNNGSDQQQLLKLRDRFANNYEVNIFDEGINLGVSGGRNYLIEKSSAPWLFLIDNDITVQPANWFQLFILYTQQFPNHIVVVPKLYNLHEQAYGEDMLIVLQNGQVKVEIGLFTVTNCFPGGASLVHRSVFATYGLFDEGMFVGFEDYEFALRAILSDKGPIQVHAIEKIELIHDHRFQKQSKDKTAVKQRYDYQKLKASYDRMVHKHNIIFEHDWQWWTDKQIQLMTQRKTFINRFKEFIISKFKI